MAERQPHSPDPQRRKPSPMNSALDVQEITSVVPIDPDNESDERGWWPVVAFTDDVRPIVFEFNIN
jgi:hypothetical protein